MSLEVAFNSRAYKSVQFSDFISKNLTLFYFSNPRYRPKWLSNSQDFRNHRFFSMFFEKTLHKFEWQEGLSGAQADKASKNNRWFKKFADSDWHRKPICSEIILSQIRSNFIQVVGLKPLNVTVRVLLREISENPDMSKVWSNYTWKPCRVQHCHICGQI